MEENLINRSPAAPIAGVYRYELIPAEKPMDYYIDLWFQFGMGSDPKKLLSVMDDAFYLEKGEYIVIDLDGNVSVKKKERHLKLVIING
jgi:hypothetical protein